MGRTGINAVAAPEERAPPQEGQLTPVSPLDQGLLGGTLGCQVLAVSPAPGEAAGAQEGIRDRQQT